MRNSYKLKNRIDLAVCLVLLAFGSAVRAQTGDAEQIEKFFDAALTNGKAYGWLNHLSNQIGGRLSGSIQAEQAVEYTKAQMDSLALDRVWLQPVMVPKWVRGTPEFAFYETDPGITTNVPITALGGSVATPPKGIKAGIVEVQGIKGLEALGKSKIAGNIVFFNKPMDAAQINTFNAYSDAVSQRYSGAEEAAKFGAVGVIVRSLTHKLSDFPHTGVMAYGDGPVADRIPAAAISTNAAELLSTTLKLRPDIQFYFKQNCKQLPDVPSHNVIGEIKGSQYPDEIILVGAHLDSWDLGDGAHDDGAGCVQAMEVLRLMKEIGYAPKRTIRAVLFMNEENGLRGGTEYAKQARAKGEKHIFALESDAGGFTPRGFSFDAGTAHFNQVLAWKPLFEPYFIHSFVQGGSGADIGPLKEEGMVLAGLRPDSQRYFDHHHSDNDTFEHVNKRELELGAAAMAALVYLYDAHGVVSQP
ncbi:M28 family peptidase [Maribacter sp. 2307ULW6-5]|uniref:M28 family peptidase n=1 Tax=Maribacter sp. 2307ULW6-5 TaxID=3386275 RepID=UPI0039BCB3D2